MLRGGALSGRNTQRKDELQPGKENTLYTIYTVYVYVEGEKLGKRQRSYLLKGKQQIEVII